MRFDSTVLWVLGRGWGTAFGNTIMASDPIHVAFFLKPSRTTTGQVPRQQERRQPALPVQRTLPFPSLQTVCATRVCLNWPSLSTPSNRSMASLFLLSAISLAFSITSVVPPSAISLAICIGRSPVSQRKLNVPHGWNQTSRSSPLLRAVLLLANFSLPCTTAVPSNRSQSGCRKLFLRRLLGLHRRNGCRARCIPESKHTVWASNALKGQKTLENSGSHLNTKPSVPFVARRCRPSPSSITARLSVAPGAFAGGLDMPRLT